MYVCIYVCVLEDDGVKAERYAVCITSAVLHCLDKLMTDSKFISEFTRTQKEDDNLSFIFRIVSACAHLKEYTIANFSHRNSYIDTVATYFYSTFIYNSVYLLLSLIYFPKLFCARLFQLKFADRFSVFVRRCLVKSQNL